MDITNLEPFRKLVRDLGPNGLVGEASLVKILLQLDSKILSDREIEEIQIKTLQWMRYEGLDWDIVAAKDPHFWKTDPLRSRVVDFWWNEYTINYTDDNLYNKVINDFCDHTLEMLSVQGFPDTD